MMLVVASHSIEPRPPFTVTCRSVDDLVAVLPEALVATVDAKLKGCRQLRHVLEHGGALARFRHHREMIAAFWTRLGQDCLFDVQVERFVLNMRASRADADQASSLELEVRDDVFHDCA